MILTVKEAAEAIGGKVIVGENISFNSESIATDSNKAAEGALFIPVIGARVDGHRFIEGAFDNGASCTLTSKALSKELLAKAKAENKGIIMTEDNVAALQRLGAFFREKYVHIPYIGVTGSVGKTTTREMIACAVSAGFDTYSTKGNANSQTGVPITVMATPESAGIGVIEMGISEFGEMHRLSEVVKCDMAVMTVIGISHIANLGSQENIMKEKLHILDDMPDGARLFLNGDDPLLKGLSEEKIHAYGIAEGKRINISFYGTGDNAEYKAVNIKESSDGSEFDVYVNGRIETHARLFVPGTHMILNALAAIASAFAAGVDIKKAAEALSSFKSLDGRGEIRESRGIKVINDAYNAAPQSVKAGLRVLNGIQSEGHGRHTAVLADMLELGDEEVFYHEDIGRFIVSETPKIDKVMLYGKLSSHILEGIRNEALKNGASVNEESERLNIDFHNGRCLDVQHFNYFEGLSRTVKAETKAGDTVFFKGSNSMKLWSMAKELIGE